MVRATNACKTSRSPTFSTPRSAPPDPPRSPAPIIMTRPVPPPGGFFFFSDRDRICFEPFQRCPRLTNVRLHGPPASSTPRSALPDPPIPSADHNDPPGPPTGRVFSFFADCDGISFEPFPRRLRLTNMRPRGPQISNEFRTQLFRTPRSAPPDPPDPQRRS